MPLFSRSEKKKYSCEVCGVKFPASDLIAIRKLGHSSIEGLHKVLPDYHRDGYICRSDLRKIRTQIIRMLFEKPEGELGGLEHLFQHEVENYPASYNQEFRKEMTWGDRLSELATRYIGSWGFIALFLIFVIIWVSYNTQSELKGHFDPFPFILLNLFLSCMAAIQAPVIMMAQKRIYKRETFRADEDFYTNLKAELEIRQLHAKLDELIKKLEERK